MAYMKGGYREIKKRGSNRKTVVQCDGYVLTITNFSSQVGSPLVDQALGQTLHPLITPGIGERFTISPDFPGRIRAALSFIIRWLVQDFYYLPFWVSYLWINIRNSLPGILYKCD